MYHDLGAEAPILWCCTPQIAPQLCFEQTIHPSIGPEASSGRCSASHPFIVKWVPWALAISYLPSLGAFYCFLYLRALIAVTVFAYHEELPWIFLARLGCQWYVGFVLVLPWCLLASTVYVGKSVVILITFSLRVMYIFSKLLEKIFFVYFCFSAVWPLSA